MNFKAIGFDYGGVVAGTPGHEFEKRVASLLGVDLKIFQDVYFEFNNLVNTNVLSLEDFWRKVTAKLDVSDKYYDLMKFIKEPSHHEINKQIINLIGKLRNAGYKTGLLSNNTMAATSRFRKTKLINHFDTVVVSAEIGYSKPHLKAFEIFIKRLGIAATELVFIDDTERSLSTAKKIGFYPVLFTNYESLLHTLKSIGIEV